MIRNKIFRVGIPMLVCAMAAHAATITYQTAPGATESGGNPVNAKATFTTGAGTLDITLTNLLPNPTTVAQLISDLDFVLSNGATVGTLGSSSGQEITVAADGSFVLGGTVSTGWGLVNNFSGGLQLTAIGFVGPAHLIIGPPGGATYSAANGSISGNGPHNPFLNQSATFHITGLAGVTASTTVSSATFSFGTVAGDNVPGGGVPEPISLLLTGSGLIGLFLVKRRSAKR